MFFCLFISLFCEFSFSQSWDSNYYDRKVLYDNADLLQLNEYEKLKLRSQELERNRVLSNQDANFYDLDNSVNYENSNDIIERKSEKNKSKYSNRNSFSAIVDQVSENISTGNFFDEDPVYFIDF